MQRKQVDSYRKLARIGEGVSGKKKEVGGVI